MLVLPQIGNWIAWFVGNRKEVRLGEDTWVGAGESYKLSWALIEKHGSFGISNLNQACTHTLQRETLWKKAKDLGLEEGLKKQWNDYVSLLQSCFIHLEEDVKDKLAWTKNPTTRDFTAKLCYKNWGLEQY